MHQCLVYQGLRQTELSRSLTLILKIHLIRDIKLAYRFVCIVAIQSVVRVIWLRPARRHCQTSYFRPLFQLCRIFAALNDALLVSKRWLHVLSLQKQIFLTYKNINENIKNNEEKTEKRARFSGASCTWLHGQIHNAKLRVVIVPRLVDFAWYLTLHQQCWAYTKVESSRLIGH